MYCMCFSVKPQTMIWDGGAAAPELRHHWLKSLRERRAALGTRAVVCIFCFQLFLVEDKQRYQHI